MQLIPLLINFTSFAQLQIKDKLRTFPRREGFTRNKEKISNLICFGPFVPLPLPYSLPRLGRSTPLICFAKGKEKPNNLTPLAEPF